MRVPKTLRQAEINTINERRGRRVAHREIGWFYISVYEMAAMQSFAPLQHLVGEFQRCFERKTPPALREQFFERRSQQIQNHDVEIVMSTIVLYFTDAAAALQLPIHLVLVP